ncbi:MAG TPA: hypothetical protein VHZ24_06210 [Pirellulales bacterium]|jgi:hypothetical protein|nr:hypothetical protein [Pirellulales bacterium]
MYGQILLQGFFAAAAALAAPNLDTPSAKPQNPRVLFIVAPQCARCDEELGRLNRPGGDFETMRSIGWKIGSGPDSHLQIVNQADVADLVRQLDVQEYPAVVSVSGDEIVRSFRSGCTTPLDSWTFGWLAKGVNERPTAEIPEAVRVEWTGNYPLRGGHWSIDGDWSPSRETLVGHLRGPVHGPQIRVGWVIESWSYEELRSLHDNLHEQEMGGISYYARQPAPPSASKKMSTASSKALGR